MNEMRILLLLLFAIFSCWFGPRSQYTGNKDDNTQGILKTGPVSTDGQYILQKRPLIFPVPKEVTIDQGNFIVDRSTSIILPEKPGETDIFLATLLSSEFTDRYGQPVNIEREEMLPSDAKIILVGDLGNPLIMNYCTSSGLLSSIKSLGDEGYILSVTDNKIVVASGTGKGALYGFESLRQIISLADGQLSVPQILIKDKPHYPFRGIKLYLPGRDNKTFFKKFVKDFVAAYKFNTVILELNANMRLEKHPELNAGAIEFYRYLNNKRLDRPPGKHNEYQNSSHQGNADGGILEKSEVADIVSYLRKFNIEVIPELPSLTHSYYLLWGHRDLAENPEQPFPDTYCPLKPGSYKLYFDVLDEYIDVIHPSIIHIGHDEWRMEKDICELCRGKDYGDLYAGDLNKIHDYLAGKGIKTAIWGDHLLESVTGKDHRVWKSSSGYEYKIPGALRSEQVLKSIPKDILIFNWFWDEPDNDRQLSDFGFTQVFGNMRADINDWEKRSRTKGILGGAPSSWAATTETNLGKDQLLDFLGCSNLLWSEECVPFEKLVFIAEPLISEINYRFTGNLLPSDAGSRVTPLDISIFCNTSLSGGIYGIEDKDLVSGKIGSGNKIFNILSQEDQNGKAIIVNAMKNQPLPQFSKAIPVDRDVNSILFLHACTREAANRKAYSSIFSFDETAELLGWYEIRYEDGFVESVPVRYGINILDTGWRKRIAGSKEPVVKYSQNQYAYRASAVECSKEPNNPATFFAYEWVNPRMGKVIKDVTLKAVNQSGSNENAIILLGLSVTENSKGEQAAGYERQ
jgi:hypothetical protein